MSGFGSRHKALPTEWQIVSDLAPGTVFQVVGPGGPGEFRSNLSLSTESPGGSPEEEPLEVVHDRQLASAFLLMTDALLLDHRPVFVAGRQALVSTIAFRQGHWTLTSMLWTIDMADVPVVAVATCDADRFDAEAPLFERLVAAIPLGAVGNPT